MRFDLRGWRGLALATLAGMAVLPTAAQACDNLPALIEAAYPQAVKDGEQYQIAGDEKRAITPDAVACKVWPYKTAFTLLAVPLVEADPAQPDEIKGDIEVIVVDTKLGKPLVRRMEKGMAYSDAISFGGVKLDTARYDIRSGERAFGVVTSSEGGSRPNPYSASALWLYRFDGRRLERVLDGLVIKQFRGETDTTCAGEFDETTRTLTVLPEKANDYHNLRVDQSMVEETVTEKNNDCVSAKKPAKTSEIVLSFKDGRYQPAEKIDGLFSFIEIEDAK